MFFEGCFRLSCTRQTFFISTMLLRTFSRLRCFFSSACSRLKNPKRMQRMRSQTAFVFSWNGIRSVNIKGVKKVWCKEQKVLEANTVLLKHKEITIPANQAMGDSEQVKNDMSFPLILGNVYEVQKVLAQLDSNKCILIRRAPPRSGSVRTLKDHRDDANWEITILAD